MELTLLKCFLFFLDDAVHVTHREVSWFILRTCEFHDFDGTRLYECHKHSRRVWGNKHFPWLIPHGRGKEPVHALWELPGIACPLSNYNHRHAQRCVSKFIRTQAKLMVKMNHPVSRSSLLNGFPLHPFESFPQNLSRIPLLALEFGQYA